MLPVYRSGEAVEIERVLIDLFQDTVSLPKPIAACGVLERQLDAVELVHALAGLFDPAPHFPRGERTDEQTPLRQAWVANGCCTKGPLRPYKTHDEVAHRLIGPVL